MFILSPVPTIGITYVCGIRNEQIFDAIVSHLRTQSQPSLASSPAVVISFRSVLQLFLEDPLKTFFSTISRQLAISLNHLNFMFPPSSEAHTLSQSFASPAPSHRPFRTASSLGQNQPSTVNAFPPALSTSHSLVSSQLSVSNVRPRPSISSIATDTSVLPPDE